MENRFSNFLLLNASFERRIGLFDGKSLAVLFFLNKNGKKGQTTAFSFIEEIQEDIGNSTPLNFGSGLAGFGCLIEHLHAVRIITDSTSELLEEPDEYILSEVYNSGSHEPGLWHGASGLGLYLLSRIGSLTPPEKVQLEHMKSALETVITKLRHSWSICLQNPEDTLNISIWNGWPGVCLFLQRVSKTANVSVDVVGFHAEIIDSILRSLDRDDNHWNWTHLDCLNVILQATHCTNYKQYVDHVYKLIRKWENCIVLSQKIAATEKMWYCLTLHMLEVQLSLSFLGDVSRTIKKEFEDQLADGDLQSLFSVDEQGDVNIGLVGGLCGVILPFQAMAGGCYEWLSLLGFSFNGRN